MQKEISIDSGYHGESTMPVTQSRNQAVPT